MAKRRRPRLDRAAAVDDETLLEQSRQKLWRNLPDIMEKAVEMAKEGNAQVMVATLRIVERYMTDRRSGLGESLLDKIAQIRGVAKDSEDS